MTSLASLPGLSDDVVGTIVGFGPGYERSRLKRRILHIGPGAFFRAHQADYFDRLNRIDPQWGIVGLSLRSPDLSNKLRPQNGLYTLAILDRTPEYRVIGSLLEVRHAGQRDAINAFQEPDLSLITLTITEKGYCLDPAGLLDLSHPDIKADIASPASPVSAPGWIVHGLSLRRSAGLQAPIVLSCDNLPGNGGKLRRATIELANKTDPALGKWIEDSCAFPCSMVDSITPATDHTLIHRVEQVMHIRDAAPIQREAFSDWVIEKVSDERMPPLDRVGARFTDDVEAFEQAKLRLLNGPHSALAYLGLAYGYETVSDAIADTKLRSYIAQMMAEEIAPTLQSPEGMNLAAYQADLIERFSNPAIQHKLSQIAWDGSKKLPIRLLSTIADNLEAGRPVERLATGVAAWWRFVIRQTRKQMPIVDPLSERLGSLANQASDSARPDIDLLLSVQDLFGPTLIQSRALRESIELAYQYVLSIEARQAGGN